MITWTKVRLGSHSELGFLVQGDKKRGITGGNRD